MWNAEYAAGRKPKASALKKHFNSVKYQQYPWMREVHRDAHADPFERVGRAWSSYFKALKRGDKQARKPKFHKRGRKASFYVANDKLSLSDDLWLVRLPVVGWVRVHEQLRFLGKIMGAVVSRVADRWFISIQVEVEHPERHRTGNGIAGVDWGVKNALTITRECDGKKTVEFIPAPKPLAKVLRKLRRMERSKSRRKKGGKNRAKLVRKIARVHARAAAIRRDFWHKITTRLCRENQAVGIESLNARGMAANRKLSRAIADVGCYILRQQLAYKSKLYGTLLAVADQWYPSSKRCNRCGAVKKVLGLWDRVFCCGQCGYVQDRDVNASQNLCALAKHVPTACGEITLGDSGAVRPLIEPRTKPCVDSHSHTN